MLVAPVVSRGQGGYSRRRPSTASASAGPYTGPAVTFKGTLRVLDKKEMILDLDSSAEQTDEQSLTLRRTGKTKFFLNDREIKATDVPPKAHVTVDATREGDSKLAALKVMLGADKPAEGKPATSTTVQSGGH